MGKLLERGFGGVDEELSAPMEWRHSSSHREGRNREQQYTIKLCILAIRAMLYLPAL